VSRFLSHPLSPETPVFPDCPRDRGRLLEVRDRPGLGIELDWERLAAYPYERQHLLRLFTPGWEKRGGDDAASADHTAPAAGGDPS
jgi:hypothetical protein